MKTTKLDLLPSMKKSFLKVILVSLMLSLPGNSFAMEAPQDNNGFLGQVRQMFADPLQFASDNTQMLHLIRDVFSLFYILTVDSTDPALLKGGAAASALSINAKNAYELFRTDIGQNPNDTMGRMLLCRMIFDQPKVGAYFLASIYDIVRFMEAPNTALLHKQEEMQERMRSFKFNQVVYWIIEVLLRVVSHCGYNSDVPRSNRANLPSRWTAELADYIEIFRLLSRYSVYIAPAKIKAHLRIDIHHDDLVTQQEEAEITEEEQEVSNLQEGAEVASQDKRDDVASSDQEIQEQEVVIAPAV